MTTLEDRLREHLRDEVAGLDVPDLVPPVLAVGRRARQRRRLLAAAGMAVLVAAVGGAVGLRGQADRAVAPPAVRRPFTVLTRTDLAGWGPPSGIAAVPGGVWLMSWDTGALIRVDAATGRITARVAVGGPQQGPYAIAYGAGSLWVSNFLSSDLLRLNPVTGHRIATIHLPGGIRYVTVGGGYVWVTVFGLYGRPAWNRLIKIDPATDGVVAIRPVPGNYGPGGTMVAATSSAVWLHIDGGPAVQAVSPASMHVLASAPSGPAQFSWALAATGRHAWVLTDGTLRRIDPPWSAVSRQVRLYTISGTYPVGFTGPYTLAPGQDGTLWAAGPALYHVNEVTMRATRITGFGAIDNLAVLGRTLWVQADDDVVYQVALSRPSTAPTVPDVVLMPLNAARRLLAADGFAVRVVRRVGLEPLGKVIFQSPSAGSLVPRGTTVVLFVSAGPAL